MAFALTQSACRSEVVPYTHRRSQPESNQCVVLLVPLVDDLHVAVQDLRAVCMPRDGGNGLAVLPGTACLGRQAGTYGVAGEQLLVPGAQPCRGDEVASALGAEPLRLDGSGVVDTAERVPIRV